MGPHRCTRVLEVNTANIEDFTEGEAEVIGGVTAGRVGLRRGGRQSPPVSDDAVIEQGQRSSLRKVADLRVGSTACSNLTGESWFGTFISVKFLLAKCRRYGDRHSAKDGSHDCATVETPQGECEAHMRSLAKLRICKVSSELPQRKHRPR